MAQVFGCCTTFVAFAICFVSGLFLTAYGFYYCCAMSAVATVVYVLHFVKQQMWTLLIMIVFVSFCVPIQVLFDAVFAFKIVETYEARVCQKRPSCMFSRCQSEYLQEDCGYQTQYSINWLFVGLTCLYTVSFIVLLRCLYKLCEYLKHLMLCQRGSESQTIEIPPQTLGTEDLPILDDRVQVKDPNSDALSCQSDSFDSTPQQTKWLEIHSISPESDLTKTMPEAPPPYTDIAIPG